MTLTVLVSETKSESLDKLLRAVLCEVRSISTIPRRKIVRPRNMSTQALPEGAVVQKSSALMKNVRLCSTYLALKFLPKRSSPSQVRASSSSKCNAMRFLIAFTCGPSWHPSWIKFAVSMTLLNLEGQGRA